MLAIRFYQIRIILVLICLVANVIVNATFARPVSAMLQRPGVVNAPEFPDGLEWLNTDHPIKIADLRGKIVLLDFWTYCCINCMHIIPDLKKLEAKYGDALVVIGVHSAKFAAEQGTENIRQAILRYEIEHAVVNDRDMDVWSQYTARAWPTVVLIDTRGKIVGQASGEGVYETFDEPIGELVREATTAGTLKRTPLKLALEKDRAPRSVLSFPGKVLADAPSNRLFVADSNHNRIVVSDLQTGAVLDVIGAGGDGLTDGAFEKARFFHPQGLALDGETLYIADTENHAIRKADLKKRTVVTVAGNGRQAQEFNVSGVGMAVALNSPWDLLVHKGALYIAMAGSHQIWKMDLETWRLVPFAGSGRENRVDGPHARAALAQPSGLATDGTSLFVADSEVSSIRTVDLDPDGRVSTIVGVALFEFGDTDGAGATVRLQHPLGVAYNKGAVYVADTYNNKVKVLDPKKQECRTLAGTGGGGFKDGAKDAALFDEPGGISYANGKLYVADTNNSVIRTVDVETGQVATFQFSNVGKLMADRMSASTFRGEVVDLPEQSVAPGSATMVFDVAVPDGYKLNLEAPFYLALGSENEKTLAIPSESRGNSEPNPKFPKSLAFFATSGTTTLVVDTVVYYCETGKESLCYFKSVRFRVPVRIKADVGSTVKVSYAITP